MNKKIWMTLILLALGELVLADESYEKPKNQIQKLEERVDELEKSSKQTQNMMFNLKKQVDEATARGKVYQQKFAELNIKLNALEGKWAILRGSLNQLKKRTELKIKTTNEVITKRSKQYGTAITILFLLFSGGYWNLRRRNNLSERTLEKIVKSDTALTDSLFSILNKLKIEEVNPAATDQIKPVEPDHRLPLKLVDEIHRMRKRLALLPEDTKGLTPLQKSLERLESELIDHGYEIIDHAGMVYTENLSVKASFVPSDNLESDQKIISKVIVPQVNYKGVMIRMADIEVNIGS